MIVLDMHPYDAILGFDWLRAHSPMTCDWENKTLQFQEQGKLIQLQGISAPPLQIANISVHKVYKATKGNDLWAYVLLEQLPIHPTHSTPNLLNLMKPYNILWHYTKMCS